MLCGRFGTLIPVPQGCCFDFASTSSSSSSIIELFEWNPANSENHADNVKRVLEVLEKHVLPAGVRVIALQGLEWLTACIDCGPSGTLTIANSKTDYIFLTEKGVAMLEGLRGKEKKGKIDSSMLRQVLNEIIALFESKTTLSLNNGLNNGPTHQALFEYLAVNHLASDLSHDRKKGEMML
jgi:hypothetical protein